MPASGTKRDDAADIMKGILVLQMVLCHCIQFFGRDTKPVQKQICDYINLTTFSGFMFTFGLSCWYAYFSRSFRQAAPRMIRTALKCLAAFWISSICYIGLVELDYYDPRVFRQIILLEKYAGWSEFLASFAGVMLVWLLLFGLFQRQNGWLTLLCLAAGGLLTLIPYGRIGDSRAALMIGSTGWITFPVLQYLFYFAAGVWFCRRKIIWDFRIFLVCVMLSLPEIVCYIRSGCLTDRFPPDGWFLFGAVLFLYLYYQLAHALAGRWPCSRICAFLRGLGMNTVFCLLLSNLVIFSFSAGKFKQRTFEFALLFYLVLMAALWFVLHLVHTGGKNSSGR